MGEKILVLSATGNVGTHLVRELLDKGCEVRAASRSGKAPDGAEGIVFDLADPSTFPAAFDDVRAAYLMLPPGHHFNNDATLSLLKVAEERGVKIVLQTSTEAVNDPDNPDREAERRVREGSVPFAIVRPGWFMDNFHIFWAHDIRQGQLTLTTGDSKSAFIDTRDIAASAAAALTSDRFNGQAFDLTGGEAISYGEAIAILSEEIGRPVAYQSIPDADYIAFLVGVGMPRPSAEFFVGALAGVREGRASQVHDGVNRLTGRAPRTFRDYARDNASRFQ